MLLQFGDGEPYATGATNYQYRPATEREKTPRIVVSILIDDIQTLAFVDTGGVYAICPPDIASVLNLIPQDGIPTEPMLWRGSLLKGELYRIPTTIIAETGNSLRIESTFFVPQLTPDQIWVDDFPCILGMSGCLERLRFAVDPSADMFYFGRI